MKTLKFFAAALMLFALSANTVSAQEPTKSQQKQAKKMEKEGWKVKPGSLSLADQLARSQAIQADEANYITATASSVGSIYNAARMAAITSAKAELAGKIETEIASILEQKTGNDEADAQSILQTVQASKARIIQKLGRVSTPMECHKEANGKIEVNVVVAYPLNTIKKDVKNAVEEEAKANGNSDSQIGKRLDELMGW